MLVNVPLNRPRHRGLILRAALVLSIMAGPTAACSEQQEPPTYRAEFHANIKPDAGLVDIEIRITQSAGELIWLAFNAPKDRYREFIGDGTTQRNGASVKWNIPNHGGTLRFKALVDSQRSGRYDARLTNDWILVRLGDLFPPARASTIDDAVSLSSLSMTAPQGWSIETAYGTMQRPREVINDARRFDRPTGWAIAGKLAVRRDHIANRQVTIASPLQQGVRRQDLLAFLHWTLPELVAVYPKLPERLLIVSAGDPMWRGGLSGPASFYLHAERPLISEDTTSPPLHELIHVATSSSPADGDDWIAEGLAEYYSMELLRRSGGISDQRFSDAINKMRIRCEQEGGKLSDPSSGINSTRAALLFHDLDHELQQAGSSLDRLISLLNQQSKLSRGMLTKAATRLLLAPSQSLHAALAEQQSSLKGQ